jgi:hypothetical protein
MHQQAMVHRVTEAFQVAVCTVAQTLAVGLNHLFTRHSGTTARTASVAGGAAVGRNERANDLGDGVLHDSVEHGGTAQGALTP